MNRSSRIFRLFPRLLPPTLLLALCWLWAGLGALQAQSYAGGGVLDKAALTALRDSLKIFMQDGVQQQITAFRIQRVTENKTHKQLSLTFSAPFCEFSFTPEKLAGARKVVRHFLPAAYQNHEILLFADGRPLADLIPQGYDSGAGEDSPLARALRSLDLGAPLITYESRPYDPVQGLKNRHIALWPSHGYYYEQTRLRWQWQRPGLFQTVEDLLTPSYVLPYLVPMLEKAGATVFLPRERDPQVHEVVVDADSPQSGYSQVGGCFAWTQAADTGFAQLRSVYTDGQNPFQEGTYQLAQAFNPLTAPRRKVEAGPGLARWTPQIPEAGAYAVYISYKSLPHSIPDARYKVRHRGGESCFTVNQRMGGGTWIYLGTFDFAQGTEGCVELSTDTSVGDKEAVVTADAVKFGGGMGRVARAPSDSIHNILYAYTEPFAPQTSGYPCYAEGARYWMQWAGFHDTIYNKYQSSQDYTDDYSGRGRWVNALCGGSPFLPGEPGLGIPIDLSMAVHTDAGSLRSDSLVGTLAIYTYTCEKKTDLPIGESRLTSRHLCDLVQSQIVADIRHLHCPQWARRGIWNRNYAESRIPQVPSMLLEMFSHQNFADMRLAHDPQVQFTLCRAVYKGILKYLALRYQRPYTVQPLPPRAFALDFGAGDSTLCLRWEATPDALEPSAEPLSYLVYTRIDNGAFDGGRPCPGPYCELPIEKDKHYSFRVTAVNAGGESFPTETLSACKASQERCKVLVVNGFTKVSAPESFATPDTTLAGFLPHSGPGLAYGKAYAYTGAQHDFARDAAMVDNDNPGFGASYAEEIPQPLAGNSFDYPHVHGQALAAAGCSYASTSLEGLARLEPAEWPLLDLILGMQSPNHLGATDSLAARFALFPPALQERLRSYAQGGGKLLVSGAHIASGLWDGPLQDSVAARFAQEVLKYTWGGSHGSRLGRVVAATSAYSPLFKDLGTLQFHTRPNAVSYAVDQANALEPLPQAGSYTLLRFQANGPAAAVGYKGKDYACVSLGFPLEALVEEAMRQRLMDALLHFLCD